MSLDFSWDSTSALTKGYTTHNVYGRELIKQNRYSLDAPDRDGEIEISKKFPSNIIKATGRIKGTNYSNLVTSILPAFMAYLYNDSDVQLIFSDKTDRYYNAQIYDYDYPQYYSAWRPMTLEFICHDPFAYDTTADTDSKSNITTNGYQYTITNSGHYYAYPTITITFNQAQTHIYIANNNVTNNRFDISKNFSSGDELEVNCKNMTIKLNSSRSPSGLGDGGEEKRAMIRLAVGSNQIEIGTDDASLDVDVDFSFNKVYLF